MKGGCAVRAGESLGRPNLPAMRKYLGVLPALALAGCVASKPGCAPAGAWIAPATLAAVGDPVPAAAARPVVLLGEQHDSEADHAWELSTIERLYAAHPAMVLGFEMFPRADQAVLDRWVAGGLSEADFLARADWKSVWGFPEKFYLPMFRFARDHRIPMVALNVSRPAVHLVAQRGYAAVPVAAREGVGLPAPPTDAYRATLQAAMAEHGGAKMSPERVQHFIDAQLLWDRAMAEALAAARVQSVHPLVVGVMGAGHLENFDGVPHQLQALGISDAAVLIPAHDVCAPLGRHYADAVFID